jgi:hypothetical protein
LGFAAVGNRRTGNPDGADELFAKALSFPTGLFAASTAGAYAAGVATALTDRYRRNENECSRTQ